MYRILSSVKKTASGPDKLPFWFIKAAALHLASPLAHIFNLSLQCSYVPPQWKIATIIPIPKTKPVLTPSDLRPISLTPILSRLMEKIIVNQFIYPVLKQPIFNEQFAFKQTGSTNAAIIAILNFVTMQLERVPYVRCFALDFSKAFDRVSHGALFSKLANANLPMNIYNWLREFFTGRSHTTFLNAITSSPVSITASVVQGSALGPAMFVLNGVDLKPISPHNYMPAYADDTYLLVPSDNEHTINAELNSIIAWASTNNIPLNSAKSMEIIFHKPRSKCQVPLISVLGSEIPRVFQIKILGVTISDTLSITPHVDLIVADCRSRLFALSVLKRHGIDITQLDRLFNALVISRLTYAAPSWSGFLKESDWAALQAVLNKGLKWGLSLQHYDFRTIIQKADSTLFFQVLTNSNHCLHNLLPPLKSHSHDLRPRLHNRIIPVANSNISRCSFLQRMLSKNAY